MARGSPTTSSSIRSKESTVGDDSHGERFSDALEHIPDTSDETTDERLEGLSSSSKNADDGLLQTGKSFLSRCWKRVISDQHDFSIYIRLLIVVFHLVELTGRMVLPVMNFAVTIFGLGVGVGLILGNHGHNHIATRPLDASLISSAQSPAAIAIQETTYTTIQTSTSSPSCRSTLRRVVAQVQEAPSVSRGALDMPAQSCENNLANKIETH